MKNGRTKYLVLLGICALAWIIMGIVYGVHLSNNDNDVSSTISISYLVIIIVLAIITGIMYYFAVTTGTVKAEDAELEDDGKMKVEGKDGRTYTYKMKYKMEVEGDNAILISPNKRIWFSFDKDETDPEVIDTINETIAHSAEEAPKEEPQAEEHPEEAAQEEAPQNEEPKEEAQAEEQPTEEQKPQEEEHPAEEAEPQAEEQPAEEAEPQAEEQPKEEEPQAEESREEKSEEDEAQK